MINDRLIGFLCILSTFLFIILLFQAQPWYLLSQQQPINPTTITYPDPDQPNIAYFNNQPLTVPPLDTYQPPSVLGDTTTPSQKRIEVDLTNQLLYAYDGDQLVYKFVISSGKWDRTPTGTFTIWAKVRSTRMIGGSKELGTYYDLPNVPYVMFFSNDKVAKEQGFSLHGTYWHHNFGVPMSHGCINMKTEEVRQLYFWANPDLGSKTSIYSTPDNPGTPIIIYGKYQY